MTCGQTKAVRRRMVLDKRYKRTTPETAAARLAKVVQRERDMQGRRGRKAMKS